ncbi:MAG TPA: RDD family protein [Spongiibacteraceae bacterium]|jgi:uncharacterized RDD family membrane protein YckC|nr:RDD family protein [Spongiibacteraceae bacterium]HUH37514.1 RDD family protein [Spongiibacteraceae bacterium]
MSDTLPAPGVLRRLAAQVYDSFLLFALLYVATGLYQGLAGAWQDMRTPVLNEQVVTDLPIVASGPLFQLYLLAIIVLFFLYFWCRLGQTLGMQVWKLKLVDEQGALVSAPRALGRLAAATLSWAALGMGYWWIWLDREGLAWHDRLSGTRVIRVPR